MNHLDLANEVVASTASPRELRFVGCSPLTSVKNTDLLSTFICSRSLLLALLFGAKIVDLWSGSEQRSNVHDAGVSIAKLNDLSLVRVVVSSCWMRVFPVVCLFGIISCFC